MNKSDTILITGATGMVGSGLTRLLKREGYTNLIAVGSKDLDLRDQVAVNRFFDERRPKFLFLAAALAGGIVANTTYPADFIYENLMIEANVFKAAHDSGVERMVFFASTCAYPRKAAQPMREDSLLTDELEPTVEPYALAKIAGLKLCETFNRQYDTDFRAVMPTNVYGEGDLFNLDKAHVLAALIRRFHIARETDAPDVTLWGTGEPMREFIHVDDLARAALFVCSIPKERWRESLGIRNAHVNVGVGKDISIKNLAQVVKEVVGFKGDIAWDSSKPDGAPRKLLDMGRLTELGWQPTIGLREGITQTYRWFLANQATARL